MGLLFDLLFASDDKSKDLKKTSGIHDDYEDNEKEELIKEGKYEDYNFEEEDLEEDDYYYEDD